MLRHILAVFSKSGLSKSGISAALVAVAVVAQGCTSAGAVADASNGQRTIEQVGHTVRAQNNRTGELGQHPLNNVQPQQLSYRTAFTGKDHIPHTPIGTAAHDHLYNTSVGYYDASNPVCPGVGVAGDDMCPSCPGGYPGACGGRCGSAGCIRNHHAYRVQQPTNLVYPQPNAVGGAVVYPYYTHKGPSDFFRD